MILLPSLNLCIVTPPKTASTSLHFALSREPWNGLSVIGPSMWKGNTDKHVAAIPNEARGHQILVTVRHPLDRLVSLYQHYAREESFHGRYSMAFWEFANRVCRDESVTGSPVDTLYQWSISKHIEGVTSPMQFVRFESLESDLAAHGLTGLKLARENTSFRQPWPAYFDASLLAIAQPWAAEDAGCFGYDLSPPKS